MPWRKSSTPTRAGRSTTATTGSRLPRLPRVLLRRLFREPHSTKQIEDCVGWGLETTPRRSSRAHYGAKPGPEEAQELARRVQCPVLVVQGAEDAIASHTRGRALAEHTGGDLVLLEGSGTRRTRATRSSSTCCCATLARRHAVIVTASDREQTRARYPDEEGYVERDGVRVFYEVYGDAPTDVPALPDIAHLALAALEGPDPVPLAPLPRRRLRPARERPLRPPDRPRRLRPLGVRRGREGRAGGERRPGGARRRPLRRRRLGAHARRDRPGGRARRGLRSRRSCPGWRRRTRTTVSSRRTSARHRRGLGEVQPALLAPRLPRLPRVLLRPAAPRAALDEADRGLRPLGARGRRGVADPRGRGGAAALGERRGRPRRSASACAAPSS